MKAVIMAAGKGTRMGNLTKDLPKVLIEINGKPWLYYILKTLQQVGLNEIGIIVGYKKEKIKEFLKQYHFQATLIEQKEQLGTGNAILAARDWVGHNDFIAIYGDNLWSVKDFQAVMIDDKYHYVTAITVSDWQRYGVLVVENGLLVEIVEKPTEYVSNLINTGLFKFKPEIFNCLQTVKLSARHEIELTDAVTMLAQQRKVKVRVAEWWLDLSSPEDIPRVSEFLRKNWKDIKTN